MNVVIQYCYIVPLQYMLLYAVILYLGKRQLRTVTSFIEAFNILQIKSKLDGSAYAKMSLIVCVTMGPTPMPLP